MTRLFKVICKTCGNTDYFPTSNVMPVEDKYTDICPNCPPVLRTENPHFSDIFTGYKRFDVRVNDRDYQVGNEFLLIEYDPKTKSVSDRQLKIEIIYILDDPRYCREGTVIMGFKILMSSNIPRSKDKWTPFIA